MRYVVSLQQVVVVNVASKCGFTGQYKDLQALYGEYKDRGVEVPFIG
jgi:glutathione peroxidase